MWNSARHYQYIKHTNIYEYIFFRIINVITDSDKYRHSCLCVGVIIIIRRVYSKNIAFELIRTYTAKAYYELFCAQNCVFLCLWRFSGILPCSRLTWFGRSEAIWCNRGICTPSQWRMCTPSIGVVAVTGFLLFCTDRISIALSLGVVTTDVVVVRLPAGLLLVADDRTPRLSVRMLRQMRHLCLNACNVV